METQNLLYNSCSEIPLCGLCLLSTGILFKQYFTVPTQTPAQQFSYETRVHEGTSPWIWIRSHKALGVGEVTEQSHIAFSLNFFYICCEVKYFLLPTSISSLKEKMLISAILPRLCQRSNPDNTWEVRNTRRAKAEGKKAVVIHSWQCSLARHPVGLLTHSKFPEEILQL